VLNFTKPFLAFRPKIFGTEGLLSSQSERRELLLIPRRRFSISIRAAWVTNGRVIMQRYSPELVQTMRAALDEVMTKIPLEQATPGIKAAVAECILKAAANGQTSYDGLIAAASEQIQTILSMLT
jgi:hypothetical protein